MTRLLQRSSLMAICATALFATSVSLEHAQAGSTNPVNCNSPNSLQDALDGASEGDTVRVVGGSTCLENIVVKVDHVTLDGGGSATIDGGSSLSPVVEVLATDVTITGFTIMGDGTGIIVHRSASAVIADVTVAGVGGDGIAISDSSSALIERTTVTGAQYSGINVLTASSARILDSTVRMSAVGIAVTRTSAADIRDSTVSDNAFDGISVKRGSYARIEHNVITGNGEDGGVIIQRLSGIDFRGLANLIEGNHIGVNCSNGYIRVGSVQDFGEGNTVQNTRLGGIFCQVTNSAGDDEF